MLIELFKFYLIHFDEVVECTLNLCFHTTLIPWYSPHKSQHLTMFYTIFCLIILSATSSLYFQNRSMIFRIIVSSFSSLIFFNKLCVDFRTHIFLSHQYNFMCGREILFTFVHWSEWRLFIAWDFWVAVMKNCGMRNFFVE